MNICKHFGRCGGCTFLDIPYAQELAQKEATLRETLGPQVSLLEGLIPAPNPKGYRNKMELAFGDEGKDGSLALGIRKRRSFYEVATVEKCDLIPQDFRIIALHVQEFFRGTNETFFHRKRHTGSLRHLVLRRGEFTGELLICLSTTSTLETDLAPLVTQLLELQREHKLVGKITGILYSINDGVSDTVKDDNIRVLYGQDRFRESICGLDFTISAFSFFQTNSAGAEVLYGVVKEMAVQALSSGFGKAANPTENPSPAKPAALPQLAYDLYCGTGTIAQVLSSYFEKVVGIELNPGAIKAAQENMRLNGIANCEFFAGDVQELLEPSRAATPDVVVVDPPRNGLHPKALAKLITLSPPRLVYVACKPESLARDMTALVEAGYRPVRAVGVDMFPRTPHVECVMLLQRHDS